MSPRILMVLVLASGVAFGGIAVWMVMQPKEETVATPTGSAPPDASRAAHRERFFGGDPDRDVRGGQEMKPRW